MMQMTPLRGKADEKNRRIRKKSFNRRRAAD